MDDDDAFRLGGDDYYSTPTPPYVPGSGVFGGILADAARVGFSGSYVRPLNLSVPVSQSFSEATERLIGKLLNPTTTLERLAVAVLRGDDPAAVLALRDKVEDEYRD